MQKGDIVLIPFPFTDLKGSKNRPALVLIDNSQDVTLAFVSTQMKWKEATDVVLLPSIDNGLKKESLLRLSKIATIDKALVLGKIGSVHNSTIKEINSSLIELFQL